MRKVSIPRGLETRCHTLLMDIIQNSYRALSNRINADANEEICSFEEQQRLVDMPCQKETHIGEQEDEANPGKEAGGVTRWSSR